MIKSLTSILATIIFFVATSAFSVALAHSGDYIEGVTIKSNGSSLAPNELVNTTPRSIVLDVQGNPNATISLQKLNGLAIAPRGEIRTNGKYAIFDPPALESGTYVLQTRIPSLLGDTVKSQVFVVNRSSGVFYGDSEFFDNKYSFILFPLGAAAVLVAGWLLRLNNEYLDKIFRKIVAAARSNSFSGSGGNSLDSIVSVKKSEADSASHIADANTTTAASKGKLLSGTSTYSIIIFVLGLLLLAVSLVGGGLFSGFVSALSLGFLGLFTGFIIHKNVSSSSLIIFTVTALVTGLVFFLTNQVNVLLYSAVIFTSIGVTVSLVLSRNKLAKTIIATSVVMVSFTGFAGVAYSNPSSNEIIGGSVEPTVENVESCLDLDIYPSITACVQDYYDSLVTNEGTVTALNALAEDKFSIPGFLSFCHDASHAIGRASYKVEGSVGKAFETGFDVCDFGFYHGIIEGSSASFNDTEFSDFIKTVCNDLADSSDLFYMQCAHGVGHAAARRANNDLVKGFEFCEAFDSSEVSDELISNALNGCGTGVSMEWFAKAGGQGAQPEDFVPSVQFLPDACKEVPERWAADCFEYVGNTVDTSNPIESLTRLANLCNSSSESSACFKGLARAAAGIKIGDDSSLDLCMLATDQGSVERCMFMYIFTTAATVEYNIDAVDRICQKIKVRIDSYKQVCDLGLEVSRETLEFSNS